MKNQQKNAFTLVELIIVITILAILATIGFISYQSYTLDARDGKRVTDLGQIRNGLEIYRAQKSTLPKSDGETADIKNGSIVLTYQGYAGKTVLDKIRMDNETVDPTSKISYTYSTNGDYTKYQLLSLLEKGDLVKLSANISEKAYASNDYTDKKPYVIGDKLGMFLDNITNTPIQETVTGTVDLASTGTTFKVVITNDTSNSGTVIGTGVSLYNDVISVTNSTGTTLLSPVIETCPSGFIFIPGSVGKTIASSTPANGWCVAKYEMTPYSTNGWTQDTTYGPWKCTTTSDANTDPCNGNISYKIVSNSGNYPITYISRNEAERACNNQLVNQSNISLTGAHLISIDLWKLISDDILKQPINWTSGTVGVGNLSRGYADNSLVKMLPAGDDTLWTAKTTKNNGNYYFSREWALSTGDTINDFAGNVWEYYYDTHNSGGNALWKDYNYAVAMSVLGKTLDPDTNTSISGISTLSSITAGLGQIYNAGAVAGSSYTSSYGGGRYNTNIAGIFTSNWSTTNTPSTSTSYTVGFRCVIPAN